MAACLQLTVEKSAARFQPSWPQSLVTTESDHVVGWRPLEKSQQTHLLFPLLLSPQSGREAQAPSPPECNFRTFTGTLYFVLPVPPQHASSYLEMGPGSHQHSWLFSPPCTRLPMWAFYYHGKESLCFSYSPPITSPCQTVSHSFNKYFLRAYVEPVLLGEDTAVNKTKSLPP